mmetsp:Transcript_11949/g.35912  ORF Transcript_11949/g.35912 Transcript_11949/m.35912 type:complete len:220 (-) Transcript_11949:638-1297(-)
MTLLLRGRFDEGGVVAEDVGLFGGAGLEDGGLAFSAEDLGHDVASPEDGLAVPREVVVLGGGGGVWRVVAAAAAAVVVVVRAPVPASLVVRVVVVVVVATVAVAARRVRRASSFGVAAPMMVSIRSSPLRRKEGQDLAELEEADVVVRELDADGVVARPSADDDGVEPDRQGRLVLFVVVVVVVEDGADAGAGHEELGVAGQGAGDGLFGEEDADFEGS